MAGGAPRFVIQQHAARSLHYDLRLEIGGVLVSWAVPKGPSTDPRERRLALRVEDHPLGWGSFEGVIPAGYGAGAVIVWDRGAFRNETARDGAPVPLEQALAEGRLSVWLDGEKLRGGWWLRRTGREGERERWLLVKRRDEHADAARRPAIEEPESVVSGRTIEQLQRRARGARAPR